MSDLELRAHYICLLRKGPAWTDEESPELEQLQQRHLAHLTRLKQSGKTIASGPINDASDLRGFSIYRTVTLEEAQALAEADPAVQAGRFVVELHRWLTPAGNLPDPETGTERLHAS